MHESNNMCWFLIDSASDLVIVSNEFVKDLLCFAKQQNNVWIFVELAKIINLYKHLDFLNYLVYQIHNLN